MESYYRNSYCVLFITGKTRDIDVVNYLNYLFDGNIEDEVVAEIVEMTRGMKAEKVCGRLFYDLETRLIKLEETGGVY